LGGETTITGVDVTPLTAAVAKGGTKTFTARVNGTGTPSQTVYWSVEGGVTGTAITGDGTLTVAADETAQTLTVKAASTQDTTKVGRADVTVTPEGTDTTAPAKVTGLTGTPGSGQVTLTWTDPADADLDHVEITFSPAVEGVGQPISVPKGTQTRTITGLANGTAYTFTLTAVDASGNRSAGEPTGPLSPAADAPPAQVSSLVKTRGNGQVRLDWTDPADSDLDHIEITFSPAVSGITQPISVPKGTEIWVVEGLANDVEYTFTVQAVDAGGNKSGGDPVKETPDSSAPSDLMPPANVSGLTGTAGDAQVTLRWTDPDDSDLDHIEISFSPAATGVTQPISVAKGTQARVITGLANGTAYTFTVKTVDASGNTRKGVTSSALTPLAPAGQVTVQFTGPYDESFGMTESNTPLSKSKNTKYEIRVDHPYTSYDWYLDGSPIPGATSNTLTLYVGSLEVKQHELTVIVFTDYVPYSKRVSFTVGE
jgi:chitodextrinase